MNIQRLIFIFKMLHHPKYNSVKLSIDDLKLHLYLINAFGYLRIF